MKIAFLSLLCSVFALSTHAQTSAGSSGGPLAAGAALKDIRVVMHTDKGDIELSVFAGHSPITAANFLNLAKRKFYDGLNFHRVIAHFMIQGGDPVGTGVGGPGYRFEDETNGALRFDKAGVLAMANSGPNTNGSQFFITHNPVSHLDDGVGGGHYTIFGQVTKGQDVVNSIAIGDHIKSIDILDSPQPLFAAQAENLAKWNGFVKDKE